MNKELADVKDANTIAEFAHQFRSPLTVLFSLVEDLSEGLPTTEYDILNGKSALAEYKRIADELSSIARFSTLLSSLADEQALQEVVNRRAYFFRSDQASKILFDIDADRLQLKLSAKELQVLLLSIEHFLVNGGEAAVTTKTLDGKNYLIVSTTKELDNCSSFSRVILESFKFNSQESLVFQTSRKAEIRLRN